MTGDCDIQGDCVSSAGYPNIHGNNEQCTINILQDASVSVGSTFSLETCCDHLMIRDEDFEHSTRVPTSLNARESFSWSTDGSVTREGWQLCFSEPSGRSSTLQIFLIIITQTQLYHRRTSIQDRPKHIPMQHPQLTAIQYHSKHIQLQHLQLIPTQLLQLTMLQELGTPTISRVKAFQRR